MAFTLIDLAGGAGGAGGAGDININIALQEKTVDSSTETQHVVPTDGYIGIKDVIVNPYVLDSSNAVITDNGEYVFESAADGLSRVDVSVNIPRGNLQSKTVDSSTNSQEVEPNPGYDGLSKVTVNPYVLDSSTVDPSTSQITVNSAEDGLSLVIVNAVTSSIDANIAAGNIKDGVTILGVQGIYTGTVINNQNKSIDSSTNAQSVTYDSGYTGLGTVTITALNLDSIYNTLAAY